MQRLSGAKQRIVILGGGFAGAYAAQALSKLGGAECEITLIDRNNYLLFYPLLIEAGVGTLEPRHVVVPLRKFLARGSFVMGDVLSIDTDQSQVRIRVAGAEESTWIHYSHLVLALGSVTKLPPVRGLRENGFQIKSLTDAIEHRDRGIRLLELANTIKDADTRRELLTFVIVGGNYTGIELAGEYQAFMTSAAKSYPNVRPEEIRVIVFELSDRILPSVRPKLAEWAVRTLASRGVEIRTQSTLSEVAPDHVVTDNGETIRARTVVWAAGIEPNPLIGVTPSIPKTDKGYVVCGRNLRVEGFENIWAVGDSAAVHSPEGKPYAATAQNATREGKVLAKNLLATVRGDPLQEFVFEPLGSFAAIGRRSAAAEFMGRDFKGFVGWFLYRGAYLMKMPTLSRKVRLGLDWLVELLFGSEVVQLGVHRQGAPITSETAPSRSPADDASVH